MSGVPLVFTCLTAFRKKSSFSHSACWLRRLRAYRVLGLHTWAAFVPLPPCMVPRFIRAPVRAAAAAGAAAAVGFWLVPGITCIEDVCDAALPGVTLAARCACCRWAITICPDSLDDIVITVAGELPALLLEIGVACAVAFCAPAAF